MWFFVLVNIVVWVLLINVFEAEIANNKIVVSLENIILPSPSGLLFCVGNHGNVMKTTPSTRVHYGRPSTSNIASVNFMVLRSKSMISSFLSLVIMFANVEFIVHPIAFATSTF